MNSLNILSSHITPSSSPTPSRSNTIPAISLTVTSEENDGGGDEAPSAAASVASPSDTASSSAALLCPAPPRHTTDPTDSDAGSSATTDGDSSAAMDETTPLLAQKDMHGGVSRKWRSLPKQLVLTVWHSIRWVLQTLAAPGAYFWALLCDDQGTFSPLGVVQLLFQRRRALDGGEKTGGKTAAYLTDDHNYTQKHEKHTRHERRLSTDSDGSFSSWTTTSGRFFKGSAAVSSLASSSYAVSSESESEFDRRSGGGSSLGPHRAGGVGGTGASNRRSTTGSRSEDDSGVASAAGSGRSVRIKLNDDTQKQRKHRRGQSSLRGSTSGESFGSGAGRSEGGATKDISAQLKSPTSPAGALTRYPRTPAPPRPLIPRRQPSYLNLETVDRTHQKTLILDLDETLIHSMSKGGRMSTGHMVEVRLNTTFVGMGGQPSAGPQHPILYYVHKRPYCDEFLRRVCKWFNLVVFTASVQEYADPVIDWLESERKFFSARYYRQHCTFRHGAFIKDLSAVEPDLSKVMILDNSPLSYMFHQDNAIPIQGWISDHTDNDLLYLVPLLEALQYVSDVRALLALRGGEDGRHMA